MRRPKRAVHIDFHTLPGIPEFGRDLSGEAIAATLAQAQVDYANIFAQCNIGFCYFDTALGRRYPGFDRDLFGETLTACQRRDIGISAYFNLGIDQENWLAHPDWRKVFADGTDQRTDMTDPFYRQMCLCGDYGDFMLSLVGELLEKYPSVDGIFLDCISLTPCHCPLCRAEVGEGAGEDAFAAHTRRRTFAYLEKMKALVGERNLIFNSLPLWMVCDLNSHIEIECLPGDGGEWGYDYFPAAVAYARKLSDHVLYMTGRFQQSWGDFGGLKPYASLQNDIWEGMLAGVGCSVGDHMHPVSGLDPTVYRTVGRLYREVKAMEPYLSGARVQSDIGVLTHSSRGLTSRAYAGAARMLEELHLGFDILDERCDLSSYRLLILPEGCRLEGVLLEKAAAFVRAGGAVLSCGDGGMTPDGTAFALPEWDFLVPEGADPSSKMFYRCEGVWQDRVSSMITAGYNPGIRMQTRGDCEIVARHYDAYFTEHFDGRHNYCYLPYRPEPSGVTAAIRGHVCHLDFSVFTSYYENAYPETRRLVSACLARLFTPSVTAVGLPATARLSVSDTPTYRLLQVKYSYPEVRGKRNAIEEHPVLPAGVRVVLEGNYKRAYTLPGHIPVREVNRPDGKTELVLPDIQGYLCVALDRG